MPLASFAIAPADKFHGVATRHVDQLSDRPAAPSGSPEPPGRKQSVIRRVFAGISISVSARTFSRSFSHTSTRFPKHPGW